MDASGEPTEAAPPDATGKRKANRGEGSGRAPRSKGIRSAAARVQQATQSEWRNSGNFEVFDAEVLLTGL